MLPWSDNVILGSLVDGWFYPIPLRLTASLIREIPLFRNPSVCSLLLMRTAAWTSSSNNVHIASAWAEPRSRRTKLWSRWRKFRDCGVPSTWLIQWGESDKFSLASKQHTYHKQTFSYTTLNKSGWLSRSMPSDSNSSLSMAHDSSNTSIWVAKSSFADDLQVIIGWHCHVCNIPSWQTLLTSLVLAIQAIPVLEIEAICSQAAQRAD